MTRRELVRWLGALGLAPLAACAEDGPADSGTPLADWSVDVDVGTAEATLEALMDVLVPAERGPDGALLRVGAVECGALAVMALDRFVPLARAQGLLPDALPGELEEAATALDPVLVRLIAAELDAWADEHVPYTPFRDLPRASQEEVVARAYVDAGRRPIVAFVRGVCLLAFLGAVESDAGLVATGYPPFESFPDRRAVSGYPRTVDGVVEDYTWNEAPAPTPGDDLGDVLDPSGDLY
ncbi:MAG: hypothetical protein R3F59_26765 [Myxococcota bacterium]